MKILTKETKVLTNSRHQVLSTKKEETVNKIPVFLEEYQRPAKKSTDTPSKIPTPTKTTKDKKKGSSLLKKVSSSLGSKSSDNTKPPAAPTNKDSPSNTKEEKKKSSSRLSLRKSKKKDSRESPEKVSDDPRGMGQRSKSSGSIKRTFLLKKRTCASDTEVTIDSQTEELKEATRTKKRTRLDKAKVKKAMSMDRIDFFKKHPHSGQDIDSGVVVDSLDLHHPRLFYHKPGRGVRADIIRRDGSVVSEPGGGDSSVVLKHMIQNTQDGKRLQFFSPKSNGKKQKFVLQCKDTNQKAFMVRRYNMNSISFLKSSTRR